MKQCRSWIAIILCVCMLLGIAGCTTEPPAVSTPSTTPTAPTTPTTPTTPSEPEDISYAGAIQKLNSAQNLVLEYTYEHSRVVGGETYTESRIGSASYNSPGDDRMAALIRENLTFGSYSTEYYESYISGNAYTRLNNSSFRSKMSAREFMALQIPAVVLDASLYAITTTRSTDSGIIFSFSDAQKAESWAVVDEAAEITAGEGTVMLDNHGNLLQSDYSVSYTLHGIPHSLTVSVKVKTPGSLDFSAHQPVYPDNCPETTHIRAPRYFLQVLGDVCTSQALSVTYSDQILSQAYGMIRNQNNQYYTYGTGNSLLAEISTKVDVTNGTSDITENNSQSINYKDGICTYNFNDGESTSTAVTPDQMRMTVENSILGALCSTTYIGRMELQDTGDFLYITFEGNEEFAERLCDSIYSLFGLDLDTFAQSYTTNSAGGYLTINKHTGLPTAMGMSLQRTHSINGIKYLLNYQADQGVELSSRGAYESITGQPLPEEPTTEKANPLFYKVTGPDGQVMWLLGTIHVGDGRTTNLPKELMDAFNGADALAVEYDLNAFDEALASDPELMNQFAQLYYYKDLSPFSNHMSKELYDRLYPILLATGNNNADAGYIRAMIWYSTIEDFYLQQSYTLTRDRGMDQRLLKWAAQQEKPIYDIESGLSQVTMLTGFSDNLVNMLIEELLSTDMNTYNQGVNELYTLWCQGDEAALTAATKDDTSGMTDAELKLYQEYRKAMMTNRNAEMHKAAVKYLESGEEVFYAVGLAHLLGEDGLVSTLRAAGYTVEIVTYN